jgi:hypothetical protein
LGKFVSEFFLWAQALVTSLSSMFIPQHDPIVHKHFFHSLVHGRVEEYFRATHVLRPFSFTPMSSNATLIFTSLHPKSNGFSPFFLKDYKLK